MAYTERVHDFVAGELDPGLIERRKADGWSLIALEWQRPAADQGPDVPIDVPYGFRVARDCRHLEEHPAETEVLRILMRMIIADRGLSQTADELNVRGYRTRAGEEWRPTDLFRLMPALVDSAPRIFGSREWVAERRAAIRS
ncbi:MAG TPA: recombinase family protein [Bryobacteraceae bacterium]|nr:recombinase family protein [Bryobacteraceae bacterium]